MNNRRNYYRILNVQPDAPAEIILASYRTLMQELKQHPDLGGDHGNAVLINEAYATLSDPAKRDEYDHQLSGQGRDARSGAAGYSDGAQRSERQHAGPARTTPRHDACPFCHSPHGHGKNIDMDTLCLDCGSPLCTARGLQLAESDRRAIQRFAKQHAISFYTTWPQPEGYPGETQDISHNGMKFVSHQAVVKGQILKIDCDFCHAVAEVTHCERQRSGFKKSWIVGVMFVTLHFQHSPGTFVSTMA